MKVYDVLCLLTMARKVSVLNHSEKMQVNTSIHTNVNGKQTNKYTVLGSDPVYDLPLHVWPLMGHNQRV